MNEKLIELAKAAGFVVTKRREILAKDTSFTDITHNLSSFAKLVREDECKSMLQPIETCPSGITVLVLTSSGICEAELFRGHLWNMAVGFHDEVPLYWMHKPAPPQES